MDKKLILGLDVSTTTIGVSLFEDKGNDGTLVYTTSIKPKSSENNLVHSLILKANGFETFLKETFLDKGIMPYRVIIEEPLLLSNNANTVGTLKSFNGMVCRIVYNLFGICPDLIYSHDARKYGIPEIMGKRNGKGRNVLFGILPTKIGNTKIDKKMVVLHQISKRFPEVQWTFNKNLTIASENFDIADSILCVIGFMNMIGAWKNVQTSSENLLNFLAGNIAYKNMIKNLKALDVTADEKKKMKRQFMLSEFNLPKYINIS